ncbi:MAG TPA: uracil phosphoribosyltransferase [Opitutaceae bacterium]|nr:uracil phosphoribosyltransferase [Opitutaceae bacterium]
MPLHILDHPLAGHFLAHLRDRTTKPVTFRALAHQLSLLLAIEATRDLPTLEKPIETPMEATTGRVLAQPLVVVPILRAGLGMVQPFVDLFPDVSVGYIGLERDHETARARSYYHKLPPMAGARTLIVDPMLATGGSASQAIDLVIQAGAIAPRLICIVASPEGVEAVRATHPDTHVYVAAVDRALDARKYILPGLGDFGDRLYGT